MLINIPEIELKAYYEDSIKIIEEKEGFIKFIHLDQEIEAKILERGISEKTNRNYLLVEIL